MLHEPRLMAFTVPNYVNERLLNGAYFFCPGRKHKKIAGYKWGNDLIKCMWIQLARNSGTVDLIKKRIEIKTFYQRCQEGRGFR